MEQEKEKKRRRKLKSVEEGDGSGSGCGIGENIPRPRRLSCFGGEWYRMSWMSRLEKKKETGHQKQANERKKCYELAEPEGRTEIEAEAQGKFDTQFDRLELEVE